ncbi:MULTISPECIES: methyl-accepting chemotaxis protein [Gammaproteobacteria]|uniref:methyl-accepting chemotaxis protein n=1 Tax=Gammaproteobacteria TaxID=1236 RepID=UPI000DCFCA76|nr:MULTISPECIES: methyl-accepting chemotaxis protein [Gammaproteobacteria]RTE87623.1 methyl-accepting chemotaxis protein [Aliidiomarina sp. B3213]TCZ92592.1 methyl-accepting chemotaxis protein [Lysobacter sp. N42]
MQQLSFRENAFQLSFLINILLLAVSIVLGMVYQSLIPALVIGVPAVVVPAWLYRTLGDHPVSRISYGVAYMFFAALHIHQSLGFIEVHFGIFVLLAILIVFRDWVVVAVAAATIAVHHLLFMYLQTSGVGVYLVPMDHATIPIILLHALYVVIESAVLIVISRRSLREAKVSQSFFNVTDALVNERGEINLSVRANHVKSPLIDKFNGVLDVIESSLVTVSATIDSNAEISERLVSQSEQLNQGIERQTNEVRRIASAVEENTHSISETEDRSKDVLRTAERSGELAVQGQSAVSETREKVTDLVSKLETSKTKVADMAAAAEEIQTVLEVIDTIAEQTNLLALNAAIEAARAGESGRGFAVVADEVRVLASKTQGSTEKIQKTIGRLTSSSQESVKAVSESLEVVQHASAAAGSSEQLLVEITSEAERLTRFVNEITGAVSHQRQASSEITESTSTLSDMASEQVEQSNELSQISDRLHDLTENLKAKAATFKFEKHA